MCKIKYGEQLVTLSPEARRIPGNNIVRIIRQRRRAKESQTSPGRLLVTSGGKRYELKEVSL
jgi:hypothetical protein